MFCFAIVVKSKSYSEMFLCVRRPDLFLTRISLNPSLYHLCCFNLNTANVPHLASAGNASSPDSPATRYMEGIDAHNLNYFKESFNHLAVISSRPFPVATAIYFDVYK